MRQLLNPRAGRHGQGRKQRHSSVASLRPWLTWLTVQARVAAHLLHAEASRQLLASGCGSCVGSCAHRDEADVGQACLGGLYSDVRAGCEVAPAGCSCQGDTGRIL